MSDKARMSDQPLHYSLLKEHHENAARAASDLEVAIAKRNQAEKDIADARKRLASAQGLISNWYTEPAPATEEESL